jgi:transcriptional regulator with XRE-family HTH domain
MELKQMIGNNLVLWRKSKGLTQKDAMRKCGLAEMTYTTIEQGTANPTLKTIYAISKGLGISLDQLLLSNLELDPQFKQYAKQGRVRHGGESQRGKRSPGAR